MHMASALVAPIVAGTMYGSSAMAGMNAVRKINRKEDLKQKAPMIALAGAFVFAGQMVNFAIPGTGSSGHLIGGMLLASLLGPHISYIVMAVILSIQCLLFGDGGLMALGCNIWNMAFLSCYIGYYMVYRPIMNKKLSTGRLFGASMIGSIVTLQIGSLCVALESMLSGITQLNFNTFLQAMQPIHLAIGAMEGVITFAVLYMVKAAELEKMSTKKMAAYVGSIVLIVAGALSLAASNQPDGLEWSIKQTTGSSELKGQGRIYELTENIQANTAIFTDYKIAAIDNEILASSLAGITGAIATGGILIVTFYRKQKKQVSIKQSCIQK